MPVDGEVGGGLICVERVPCSRARRLRCAMDCRLMAGVDAKVGRGLIRAEHSPRSRACRFCWAADRWLIVAGVDTSPKGPSVFEDVSVGVLKGDICLPPGGYFEHIVKSLKFWNLVSQRNKLEL